MVDLDLNLRTLKFKVIEDSIIDEFITNFYKLEKPFSSKEDLEDKKNSDHIFIEIHQRLDDYILDIFRQWKETKGAGSWINMLPSILNDLCLKKVLRPGNYIIRVNPKY